MAGLCRGADFERLASVARGPVEGDRSGPELRRAMALGLGQGNAEPGQNLTAVVGRTRESIQGQFRLSFPNSASSPYVSFPVWRRLRRLQISISRAKIPTTILIDTVHHLALICNKMWTFILHIVFK